MGDHFHLIKRGIDVVPAVRELDAHPELWNQHSTRRTFDGTPHRDTSDIWVRYNDIAKRDPENPKAFNDEHIPIWYPAWEALPALRPLVFDIMALAQGEMLGGVLITKIPPGSSIAPHLDIGWHVEYYDKFYLSLKSQPGASFHCDDGSWSECIEPEPGDLYLFDNRKMHWIENRSQGDRVTLIVCVRTQMFGRDAEPQNLV